MKEEKEKRIQGFEKIISELEDDIMGKNKEISNLKRKVTGSFNYENEIKSLTEALAKKNQ